MVEVIDNDDYDNNDLPHIHVIVLEFILMWIWYKNM